MKINELYIDSILRLITEDPDIINEIHGLGDISNPLFVARLMNLDAGAIDRIRTERYKHHYDAGWSEVGAKDRAEDDAQQLELPDEEECFDRLRKLGVGSYEARKQCNQHRLELMAAASNDEELDTIVRCFDILVNVGHQPSKAYDKCMRIINRINSGGLSIDQIRAKIDSSKGVRGFRIADKRQDAFDRLEDI